MRLIIPFEAIPTLLELPNLPGIEAYASLSSRIFDIQVSSSTLIYRLHSS
jgi:hypothetical protein